MFKDQVHLRNMAVVPKIVPVPASVQVIWVREEGLATIQQAGTALDFLW